MHIFLFRVNYQCKGENMGSENNSEKAAFLCDIWRRWKLSCDWTEDPPNPGYGGRARQERGGQGGNLA